MILTAVLAFLFINPSPPRRVWHGIANVISLAFAAIGILYILGYYSIGPF